MLLNWPGGGDLRALFVKPGHLSLELLTRVANKNTLEEAVTLLAGTGYESALRSGLAAYQQTRRLSDIERPLKRLRLRRLAGLVVKDPLGIGVPLSYFALKASEVGNIRWIAQGINLGLDSRAIEQELEFPA
jgi:vacuolar-type H+-ATPase subunit C/Vma6